MSVSPKGANRPDQIVNNEFWAILTSSPSLDVYAQPITFELHGTKSNPQKTVVQGNLFASNHYLIRGSGRDEGCFQIEGMKNNTYKKTNGNDALNRFKTAINGFSVSYPSNNKYVTQSVLNQLKSELISDISGRISNVGNSNFKPFKVAFCCDEKWDTLLQIQSPTLGAGVSFTKNDVELGGNPEPTEVRIMIDNYEIRKDRGSKTVYQVGGPDVPTDKVAPSPPTNITVE